MADDGKLDKKECTAETCSIAETEAAVEDAVEDAVKAVEVEAEADNVDDYSCDCDIVVDNEEGNKMNEVEDGLVDGTKLEDRTNDDFEYDQMNGAGDIQQNENVAESNVDLDDDCNDSMVVKNNDLDMVEQHHET